MSMTRTRFSAQGTLAFGSVGAAYATLLAAISNVQLMVITNTLDKECILSFDGTNDNLTVRGGDMLVLPFTSCDLVFSSGANAIRVKQGAAGAPASGNITISVFQGY